MYLKKLGRIRNISTDLLKMRHLKALFLANNHLTRIPSRISELCNLTLLDLSNNRLRSLPSEIGDILTLCHLFLNGNQIRVLPYELGKLFRLQTFGGLFFCENKTFYRYPLAENFFC